MSLEAKATKFYEVRSKLEVQNVQKEVEEPVHKKRVKVERLVNTCDDWLTSFTSRKKFK